MGISFAFSWEVPLTVWLQESIGPIGGYLARFFSLFSEDVFLVAVLGCVYWCLDKELAHMIGINLMTNLLLCPIVKNIFPRRRPYMDNAEIECRMAVDRSADIYDINAQGYSFPSMHSSCSAALYTPLGAHCKYRWLRICIYALPSFVALSRVLLGVHYPTDVLAGLAIGYGILFVMSRIQKSIKREWILYLAILLCALPGLFLCRSNDFFSAYGLALGIFGGFFFEKHFVRFTMTKKVWRMILRTLGGILVFAAVNALCKLLMPESSLPLRTLRYAIGSFCISGPYPLLFSKN